MKPRAGFRLFMTALGAAAFGTFGAAYDGDVMFIVIGAAGGGVLGYVSSLFCEIPRRPGGGRYRG